MKKDWVYNPQKVLGNGKVTNAGQDNNYNMTLPWLEHEFAQHAMGGRFMVINLKQLMDVLYSPDLNPIEPAWALQKQHVRKHAPRCPIMLRRIARRARYRVTQRHCRGWFAHSGYLVESGDLWG